jgi:nucleoside-diphosphate-sugar epimerase
MKIFVTGATGFIGSAVVNELIGAGHEVLGLARSDEGAKFLVAAGAKAHRGSLEDLESLKKGAAMADAAIHCAFIHDFSKFKENSEIDKRAIEALGAAFAGSDHPLIVSSGIPGRDMTEDSEPPADPRMPRVSEKTAMALRARGVNVGVVRLPQVHNTVKQGLVTYLIAAARKSGVSVYVGDGQNHWPAVHVLDAARLYRLAIEKHESGARYHAVGEEGVSLRDIAEAIGRGMAVPVASISPEEAISQLGFVGGFVGRDLTASSALTQERLGWHPTGPGLIEDLDHMDYSKA